MDDIIKSNFYDSKWELILLQVKLSAKVNIIDVWRKLSVYYFNLQK